MRRVFLFGLVALAAGCCATRPAEAQDRFFGLGFRASRSGPDCSRLPRRRPLYVEEEMPYQRSYWSPRPSDEELEFRFRRRGDSAPPWSPRPRPYYEEPCGPGWGRPGLGRWLLQETPSGRLRLWALDPDD